MGQTIAAEARNGARLQISPEEARLLHYLRGLRFGEVKVKVQHGQPLMAYEAVRTVRFDSDSPATTPSETA